MTEQKSLLKVFLAFVIYNNFGTINKNPLDCQWFAALVSECRVDLIAMCIVYSSVIHMRLGVIFLSHLHTRYERWISTLINYQMFNLNSCKILEYSESGMYHIVNITVIHMCIVIR